MTKLCDLSAKARRERIKLALNGVLRQLEAPEPTAAVVKRVAHFLGITSHDEQTLLARDVMVLAKDHKFARQTDETFVRYGKTMFRWEWTPDHAKRKPGSAQLSPEELERRRAKIAADEADEWTVHPAPAAEDGGFLDEES